MKKKNISLCDYLYVDTKKILSVYNQLTGAAVSAGESAYSTVNQVENKKKYDFTIFKSDSGNAAQDGQCLQEQVKSHHALC
ncbi:MAG: hypothetical protein D3906_07845, partial [Candidatus Electrothrix sp. AUS1_2]|nr:hypothetical protein [Candidatus Electrothrix sp. AUS1_2]